VRPALGKLAAREPGLGGEGGDRGSRSHQVALARDGNLPPGRELTVSAGFCLISFATLPARSAAGRSA
jgi:hypothetical protein